MMNAIYLNRLNKYCPYGAKMTFDFWFLPTFRPDGALPFYGINAGLRTNLLCSIYKTLSQLGEMTVEKSKEELYDL